MRYYLLVLVVLLLPLHIHAQEKLTIKVTNVKTHVPLELVIVSSNSKWLAETDSTGKAIISLPPGIIPIQFFLTGYNKYDTTLTLPLTSTLYVQLEQQSEGLEEITVVASTRNNQNIENSPMKVEVLGLEEMNEEASIRPGNIGSILGDVSGVQIQQSSATSGNSNVRIQGLDGRYTQILRDGMPLFDGFSGGFGILTIPPLDLKQIELIKGSASTLYGGGAIGGLVNLISKRPNYRQEIDALVNYTSLNELNANVYAAKRNNKYGYTLFAGYTTQKAADVNNDGLSDAPDANTFIVHPRLFWYPSAKTMISAGYTGSFDTRKGGDMKVLDGHADSVHQYYEQNKSQRQTAEYIIEHTFSRDIKFTVKGNASFFNNDLTSNTSAIKGEQTSYFNEASVLIPLNKSNIVAGVNILGDNYRTIIPDTALLKHFSNFTTGIFGQYSLNIKEHTIIEAGLRLDVPGSYNLFALPRISAFHRFNEHWASRAGFGMGYKTPNPLVQQTIEYRITDLQPVSDNVKPEVSYGYNAEVNYKKKWGEHTELFINQAFFYTQVDKPILFLPYAAGSIYLANASSGVTSQGFDTYVKLAIKHWELYAGYTFTDAHNTYLPANNTIPLTPQNRWAFVLVKEIEEKWRFGLEGSYTGPQYRYDFTTTPSYLFVAAMVQHNIGEHFILVLNCENLLDERMSNYEPLYTGSITSPIFKPLWAPIDGRVINLSIRCKLTAHK